MVDNEIIHDIIGVYSVILFIFSCITNIFTLLLCTLNKKLRNVPTFIILAFIAFSDTLALCFWNIDHLLHQFYDYTMEDLSLFSCRIVTVFQCAALQWSSWLLVILTIERYLSAKIKTWRIEYSSAKKTAVVCLIVIAVIFLVNIHLLFTIEYSKTVNATILGKCVTSDIYDDWMAVHNYFYTVVPFIILLIVNILLISVVFCSKQRVTAISTNSKRKGKTMGITVIAMTAIFIIMKLPQTVTRGYFVEKLSETPSGLTIIFIVDTVSFTYHGTSFLILYFTNRKFRDVLREFSTINRTRISAITVTQEQ